MNTYLQQPDSSRKSAWTLALLKPVVAALLIVILTAVGCASSSDTAHDTAPGAHLAADRRVCPSGYLLVCEVRSANRISDGRYGFRGGGRKKCGCESEDGLEAIKRSQILTNSN